MWNLVKRWWLRRSGGHCILIETDSFSRFRRGELVTAGLDTFMVIATLRLPPRPRDVVRRWEIWVVPIGQPSAPRPAWRLIDAAIARACVWF